MTLRAAMQSQSSEVCSLLSLWHLTLIRTQNLRNILNIFAFSLVCKTKVIVLHVKIINIKQLLLHKANYFFQWDNSSMKLGLVQSFNAELGLCSRRQGNKTKTLGSRVFGACHNLCTSYLQIQQLWVTLSTSSIVSNWLLQTCRILSSTSLTKFLFKC